MVTHQMCLSVVATSWESQISCPSHPSPRHPWPVPAPQVESTPPDQPPTNLATTRLWCNQPNGIFCSHLEELNNFESLFNVTYETFAKLLLWIGVCSIFYVFHIFIANPVLYIPCVALVTRFAPASGGHLGSRQQSELVNLEQHQEQVFAQLNKVPFQQMYFYKTPIQVG